MDRITGDVVGDDAGEGAEEEEVWLERPREYDDEEEEEFDDEEDGETDERDSCFFADVMIEDAHHLVESPGYPTQPRQIQQGNGKDNAIVATPPPPPLVDGKNTIKTSTSAARVLLGNGVGDPSENNNEGIKNTSNSAASTNGHNVNNNDDDDDDASSFDEREMNRLSYMEIALRPQESSDSNYNNDIRQSPIGDPLSSFGRSFGIDNTTAAESQLRRRRPALPRDIGWAAFATVFCPLSLMLPWYISHHYSNKGHSNIIDNNSSHQHDNNTVVIHGWQQVSLSRRAHVATFVSALAAYGVSNFLSTLMYRNPSSGDDGEEERHLAAGRITLVGHYVALFMYPTLIAMIWTEFPDANNVGLYTIILLVLGIRDFWVLRKSFKLMSLVDGRGDAGRGRRMFFQTLTCASLDVISRSSLRRMVFFRIVSGALVIQVLLVLWWRSALFQSLSTSSAVAEDDDNNSSTSHTLLIFVVLVGGKWLTAIIARILGFVASGGIIVWFEQQQRHLERTSAMSQSNHSAVENDDTEVDDTTTSFDEDDDEEGESQTTEDKTEEELLSSDDVGSSSGATSSNGDMATADNDSSEIDNGKNNSTTTKDDARKEKSKQQPRRSRRQLYSNPTRRNITPNIPVPMLDLWEDPDYMAEAYTSVNRNEYRSVNDFEDPTRIQLDDSEWGEEQLSDTVGPSYDDTIDGNNNGGLGNYSSSSNNYWSGWCRSFRTWLERLCAFRRAALQSNYIEGTTAKHFLLQATTLSFGSVAQCALLGGVAQVLWSCTRNIRFARIAAAQRRRRRRYGGNLDDGGGGYSPSSLSAGGAGFQTMEVGDSGEMTNSSTQRSATRRRNGSIMPEHVVPYIYAKASRWSTIFIRSHTDYGMAFVAAYFKSYHKASKHAFRLIDASGLAAIVHDDISTSICSSVCFALSGIIVVFVGVTLSHHRGYLSDTVLCDTMVISFLMCYVIIFTTLEPLRASIKALYVCYAQYPTSLSQAFPLVYHRLDRISLESFNQ